MSISCSFWFLHANLLILNSEHTVWVKKVAPLKLCNIFTQAYYISAKFCQFVANVCPHIFTNFAWFILIFNKMALNFSRGTHVVMFQVSRFTRSNYHDCHQWWVVPSSSDFSPLDYQIWGQCWKSYYKLQLKVKTVPEFKDALHLICSALLEKAIGNTVKVYHKWLQACVSEPVVVILNI